MSSKLTRFLQHYRVFFGFVFAVVFLVFSRPAAAWMAGGFALALVGLAIRMWACGHIRKEKALDTSGPYAYTRNPLYFGSFIVAIGFGLASGSWWLAALTIAFFASIYLPVINVEAEELEDVLGEEYTEYALNVPLFFPRLTAWKKSGRKFDFQLYLRHGEFNAALGLLAAAAILALKAYYYF
ncbi:MAG TPA: isoprenylcysteine carboxylmethyltransferase family protein [Pyrinomonadaceae bacterium]|nr:isoprenylcysteine carboxylmethyltransferase family protein [Pyrinomonadaceae bacterium]